MSVAEVSVSNPLHLVESQDVDFLTREQEIELFREYHKSGEDSVGDRIFFHYARLVPHIARNYQGKGLELYDLVQEGYAGLVKAIRIFDVEKGLRFSTLATRVVSNEIAKALINTGRGIRIPQDIVYGMRDVIIAENDYVHKHGHFPESGVLQKLAGLPNGTFQTVQYARKVYISSSLDQMIQDSMSRDIDRLSEVETKLGLVTDELRIGHEALLELNRVFGFLDEIRRIASERFSPKNRDIFLSYYGFSHPEFHREDVALICQRYNITQRQVENVRSSCVKKMKKYLPGFQISDFSEERISALLELSMQYM